MGRRNARPTRGGSPSPLTFERGNLVWKTMTLFPMVLAVLLALLVGALATYAVVVGRAVPFPPTGPLDDPSETAELLQALAAGVAENSTRIDELLIAVDEGIKGVARAENRVQKTVSRARRLLRESGLEHAGLEAEALELREADEERSPEPELPAMPEPVGAPGHETREGPDELNEVLRSFYN